MAMHENEPHIPEPLERELRSAFGGGPGVTPEVDRAVLEMALRVGMAQEVRRRKVGVRRLRLTGLGAAAALVAGAITAWVMWPSASVPPGVAMAAPGPDINGDGRLNMLDALVMAERVEQGLKGWDFNADGQEDRADAEALAADVVKLERGTLRSARPSPCSGCCASRWRAR